MGLRESLQRLLGRFAGRSESSRYADWYTDAAPIFSEFGRDVYMSDFVNNAIDRIASEVGKVEVWSVIERSDPATVFKVNDEISRLFRFRPNELQTTKDFMCSIEWLRRKNGNAFIYPAYEEVEYRGAVTRRYTGFYPLNPVGIRIGTNEAGAVWEVELSFADGAVYTLPYSELIHIRWRRGSNLILGGGNDYGTLDTRDVLRTVTALDKAVQGLPKSIEASLQVKGIYKVKSVAERERLDFLLRDFEKHIYQSRSGIVATDLAGDLVPANFSPANIPTDALNFLKSVISERYGVSPKILSGNYTGSDHASFYQTAIEEFIVEFEQAFSSRLFTPREQDVGHRVKVYYNKIAYLSSEDKLDLANLAKATGLMTLNQVAEMFGMAPFEGGDRRLQSLNYVNNDLVDTYQMNMSKSGSLKFDDPDQGVKKDGRHLTPTRQALRRGGLTPQRLGRKAKDDGEG